MGIESKEIWMDGSFVPYDEAQVHVLSHTLHYGLGVFEGIRAYRQKDGGGGIFRLDEHLERMFDSAKMCRMKIPFSYDEVRAACVEVLRRNDFEEAYIRPLVFLGHDAMGLGARSNPVHVVIAAWNWGAYLGDDGIRNGIKLGVSSFTRHHPNANLQRAKVIGHYVNSILARYEANESGYDEALLLDSHGYVAEGTGENLFVVRGNVIKTPPIMNILGGITRKTSLEILARLGHDVVEMPFGRDALYVADEIFLTGTAAEITPVREIDRMEVRYSPGPITKRVQEIYLGGVRGEVDWMRDFITRV